MEKRERKSLFPPLRPFPAAGRSSCPGTWLPCLSLSLGSTNVQALMIRRPSRAVHFSEYRPSVDHQIIVFPSSAVLINRGKPRLNNLARSVVVCGPQQHILWNRKGKRGRGAEHDSFAAGPSVAVFAVHFVSNFVSGAFCRASSPCR